MKPMIVTLRNKRTILKSKTKIMNSFNSTVILLTAIGIKASDAQSIPSGKLWTVVQNDKVKVHTYMSPAAMFANTSHIIELENEIIIVDGQFFAPYALELKRATDSIGKPISRFYISHDHPDHYIGFGDAFPSVKVYALEETKESIEKDGQGVLLQRQAQFGPMIAS